MPKITAHRGVWTNHLENTLGAVQSAIEAGVDFVEIDVRLTSDGQVVVIHDETLERLWGLNRRVDELPWAVVSGLRIDSPAGGQRIPLLSEVLELFVGLPDAGPTLLIDMDHQEVATPAWQVVQHIGLDVAWCGNLDGMLTIRALDEKTQIWMPWNRSGAPSAEETKTLRPSVINSNHYALDAGQIAKIKAQGFQVSLWTVDDVEAMRWSVSVGADMITSNRVDLLKSTLSNLDSPGDELSAALNVARDLARFAIEFTKGAQTGVIRAKANAADLVTEVDTAVESVVRRVIGERFPEHEFVGEEFGGSSTGNVPCWYLDPVDGTTNLANGLPWTSFSLALVIAGNPVVGVVADPWRGEIFDAVAGRGAFLNGLPLRLSDEAAFTAELSSKSNLAGRVVSTELAAHLPWLGFQEFLAALAAEHCTLRIMGSGTLTVTGVAAGRGVGSVIHAFGPVDHLAGVLISKEAGAIVLDQDGNPNLFPKVGGIMVAHPAAAQELFGIWKQSSAIH